MATPVGLVQSNLIIDRLNDDITNDTTSFIVDLSNRHRLQQISFDLNLNTQIIQLNKFSVQLTSGLGLSYLSMVNNANEISDIQHDDFHSQPGTIVSDQDNISHWRPSIVYGANMNYLIDHRHHFGLSLLRKSDLNAIFKMDDFSTLLNRQHFQIYYRRKI